MTNLNEPDFLGSYVSLPNNLFALLAKYHVLVPGLQRHYVQGEDHPHAKEVRKRFIEDIVTGYRERKSVSLDFIYGPVDTVGADAFVPVDGQQRLTTIWLLARYFGESADDVTRDQTLQLLSRFSYEDRTHATRFCHELTTTQNHWEVENLPSAAIVKSTWFNSFWWKDSTVSAMLNTLDTIHELCQKDGAGKINAKEMLHYIGTQLLFRLCVDTFGQDIYMKMNARGLTLTQWENFKGRFAERVKEFDTNVKWNERIEVLSNAYFDRIQCLPDNVFFALMARILVYEARTIKIDPVPINIFKLAKHTDADWEKELPHVPFGEFELLLDKLQISSAEIAKSFLDVIDYVVGSESAANILTPYWQDKKKIIQCLFCPENKNELDFSLCLYEYFKKFPKPNSEDFTLALRLIWNILENVRIGDEKNQFNRVTGVAQIIQENCQSLYPEKMSNNASTIQYVEESVKATVYFKKVKDDIELMQSVEELMHGRIRLGVLDLNNNNLPAFRHERLSVLKKLFELYNDADNRKKIVLMIVAAAPYNPNHQESALLSVENDSLRGLLTKSDDRWLQSSLLDFLSGWQDIMHADCRDILDKNGSKFKQDEWWQRDWRKTIVQIAMGINGYGVFTNKDNNLLWGRSIKWHHNSGRFYLYDVNSGIIRKALPINDYRIELLLPENATIYKGLGKNFDSVAMNDAETRSGEFKPSKSDNAETGVLSRRIYFFPWCAEVRSWSQEEKKFVGPPEKIGEKKTAYSVNELLIDLCDKLNNIH